jgi:N,N'-diacetylchitobiose transport system substrate-binding protein
MQTLSGKGVLPNTTSLLDAMAAAQPANAATANAAKNSWFVPMAPGWASVESGSVLQQMLVSIATGKATIDAAAKAADAQIAQQLNSAS